jgi:hypothetical protein
MPDFVPEEPGTPPAEVRDNDSVEAATRESFEVADRDEDVSSAPPSALDEDGDGEVEVSDEAEAAREEEAEELEEGTADDDKSPGDGGLPEDAKDDDES